MKIENISPTNIILNFDIICKTGRLQKIMKELWVPVSAAISQQQKVDTFKQCCQC